MELNLNSPGDLAKLEGWVIKGATFQSAGSDPEITIRLAHLAAAKPIKLIIKGTVGFGRSGNIMVVNAVLSLKSEDINEQ